MWRALESGGNVEGSLRLPLERRGSGGSYKGHVFVLKDAKSWRQRKVCGCRGLVGPEEGTGRAQRILKVVELFCMTL